MSIKLNIEKLREKVSHEVKIVAVSKFHPVEEIKEVYDAGQIVFGESRVQEIVVKQKELPEDIEWHFIGNLQRNKVKQIAPFVSLIHSVDSERLMREINKQGAANDRIIPCLIQIHIADEESKSGFSTEDFLRFMEDEKWKEYKHIDFRGLMGMATFTEDQAKIRSEFRMLKSFFEKCKTTYFAEKPQFNEISMGMTGDYAIAIDEGSTMIRVGTLIFGERRY